MWADVVFVLLAGVPTCQGNFTLEYQYYEADVEEGDDTDFYDTGDYDDDVVTVPTLTTVSIEPYTRIRRYGQIDELRTLASKEMQDVNGALRDILYRHNLEKSTHSSHLKTTDTLHDVWEKYDNENLNKIGTSDVTKYLSERESDERNDLLITPTRKANPVREWSPIQQGPRGLPGSARPPVPGGPLDLGELLDPEGRAGPEGPPIEDDASDSPDNLDPPPVHNQGPEEETNEVSNEGENSGPLRQQPTRSSFADTPIKKKNGTKKTDTRSSSDDTANTEARDGDVTETTTAEISTIETSTDTKTTDESTTLTNIIEPFSAKPAAVSLTTLSKRKRKKKKKTTSKCPTFKTFTTTTTPPPTTTTRPPLDINAIIAIIANLTYDYITNISRDFNETIKKYGIPTCPTPSTTVTTTTTPPLYNFANASLMAKCFVCGLETEAIPHSAPCADAFAGDFLPLTPVDPSARANIAKYRKYCRFLDVHNYMEEKAQKRTIYGRFTGGCGVRWTDLTGVYTQRTCRNRYKPMMGKHYASKRMAKLELALINIENGCIISPMATLLPLSRGISMYARFHACVCTGSWCNRTVKIEQWKLYITILWYWLTHRI